ncbi:MAG: hypothetical protein WDN25_26310 [Acetobacteraceae bacterium]
MEPGMDATQLKAAVKVCMFDQYGTVVDMQTGLVEAATPRSCARRDGREIRTPSSPGGGARISRTR